MTRRLTIILVIGLPLLLTAAVIRFFWLSWPVGEGPAGPPVDVAAFATVWSERPVHLLGLGDSITDGFGATPGFAAFDRLVATPPGEDPALAGITLAKVLPRLTFQNEATSGSTSLNHADLLDGMDPLPADRFVVVMLTTGGNDIIHDYGRSPPCEGAMYGATLEQARPWIANFAVRLGRMLDRIRELCPGGCLVMLADIYDPTDGVGAPGFSFLPAWPDGLAVLTAYNDCIHKAAAARPWVALLPFHATFLGHGIYCRQFWRANYRSEDPHHWYLPNIEDPNDRGYDAIRRMALQAITARRSLFSGASQDAKRSPAGPLPSGS